MFQTFVIATQNRGRRRRPRRRDGGDPVLPLDGREPRGAALGALLTARLPAGIDPNRLDVRRPTYPKPAGGAQRRHPRRLRRVRPARGGRARARVPAAGADSNYRQLRGCLSSRGTIRATWSRRSRTSGSLASSSARSHASRQSRRPDRCGPGRARSAPTRSRSPGKLRRLLAGADLGADVAHQVRHEREVEQALLGRPDGAGVLQRLACALAVERAHPQPAEALPRGGVARRGGHLALAPRQPPATTRPCLS